MYIQISAHSYPFMILDQNAWPLSPMWSTNGRSKAFLTHTMAHGRNQEAGRAVGTSQKSQSLGRLAIEGGNALLPYPQWMWFSIGAKCPEDWSWNPFTVTTPRIPWSCYDPCWKVLGTKKQFDPLWLLTTFRTTADGREITHVIHRCRRG